MRISSIRRLMRAIDGLDGETAIMERQIHRIKERLNSGVDLEGVTFTPYKNPQKSGQNRPLSKAARLFDEVRYATTSGVDGFELSATTSGIAAKVAICQNASRRFIGFSEKDRAIARGDVLEVLRRMKHGA